MLFDVLLLCWPGVPPCASVFCLHFFCHFLATVFWSLVLPKLDWALRKFCPVAWPKLKRPLGQFLSDFRAKLNQIFDNFGSGFWFETVGPLDHFLSAFCTKLDQTFDNFWSGF